MNDLITILFIGGLIALIILGIVLYHKNFKRPRLPSVYCITGAPKTGKTFLAVAFGVKTYKKNLRMYYFKYWFWKLVYFMSFKKINKYSKLEKPMLYSNIKLSNIQFNLFTDDILLRKVRVPYKSVFILDEVSVIADSMLFKDDDINEQLTAFIKFIAHETQGGSIFFDSQDINDGHFSFRRCTGRMLYLYSSYHIPFFNILEGIELINSDSNQGGVNNVISGDVQKNCYKMLFSSKYHRMYDKYCYSILTDNLPVQVDYKARILTKKDSLKIDKVVSLRKWKHLDRRNYKGEEDYD